MNTPAIGAGFWIRFVAYFVDYLMLSALLQLVSTPILLVRVSGAWAELMRRDEMGQLAVIGGLLAESMVISLVLYALVAAAYFIGMESRGQHATLGKRLLGLTVVQRDDRPAGVGACAARFVAASLSWLTLNLGHALCAWRKDRRALHDLVAGTRVVFVDPQKTAMPLWGKVIVGLSVALMVLLAVLIVGGFVAIYLALDGLSLMPR